MITTYSTKLITIIAASALTAITSQGFAQTTSIRPVFNYSTIADEAPKSAAEKLVVLESRHKQAFTQLSENVQRLPTDSSYLGSEALFEDVGESVKEMKAIRSGCKSLLNSLRAEVKTIEASSSFSDEQKKELFESAEAIAKECNTLYQKIDLSVERLGAAYTVFPKWNRVHKTYRNLKGDAKASEVIKANVEEYLKSFTPQTKQTPAAA